MVGVERLTGVPRSLFMSPLKNKSLTKAILLSASMLTVLSGAIIAPALPEISHHYEAEGGEALRKLVLTMPALAIALLAPIAGVFIDKIGRKRILNTSLLFYAVSGVSGYFIDDLILLLISRALLGVGVAGVMSTATTLIGDYFQKSERNQLLGLQASFMALGGVLFLNLAGLLADWSWRGPFLLYAFAFILIPGTIWVLVEPEVKTAPKDEVSKGGFQQPGLVTLILTFGFLGMLCFYVMPVQLPFLLQSNFGVSNSMVGLAISISTMTGALISFNYGKIKSRLTFMQIYALCFGLMGIGYQIIALANSYALILIGLGVGGLGMGLIMPNGNLCLLSHVNKKRWGRATGAMASAIFLGQFLSPLFSAPLANSWSIPQTFAFTSGSLFLLVIATFLLDRWVFRPAVSTLRTDQVN